MAELKTKPTKSGVDAFINKIPDAQKRDDCNLLVGIMRAATKSEPVMWGASIIGFGSYRYTYASGREGDWPIVGLSPRKQNLTVYIMPGFDEFGDLLAKLGKHSTGKSCLYIRRLSDIDLPTLTKIVTKSIAKMKKKYKA
ncbi:MAG: DUF1801 domain-containing protein [Micropepsaceae bacterium]